MRLRIMLPGALFADVGPLASIVAETTAGACGLLPRRLDCVAALRPGILTYAREGDPAEHYVAVDEGLLVKHGAEVLVSVRHAIAGDDLARLRRQVEQSFQQRDAQDQALRGALQRLELGLMHDMSRLRRHE